MLDVKEMEMEVGVEEIWDSSRDSGGIKGESWKLEGCGIMREGE